MSSNIRILILALLCSSTLSNAEEFSGKVIAVMDGDTLLVLRAGHRTKVRLAEIDAPEKAQSFGIASQKSLAEMVKGEQVRVVSTAVDDYGRLIAKVYVGDFNVNHEQVWRGMAWEYSRFHSNRELVAMQREAQQAKRGLWAEKLAVEPSKWRRQHPGTSAARPRTPPPSSASIVGATPGPVVQPGSGQVCSKKHCSEIGSCEEALRYLALCGRKSLDGDTDGRPCEKLCAPARGKTVSNK